MGAAKNATFIRVSKEVPANFHAVNGDVFFCQDQKEDFEGKDVTCQIG